MTMNIVLPPVFFFIPSFPLNWVFFCLCKHYFGFKTYSRVRHDSLLVGLLLLSHPGLTISITPVEHCVVWAAHLFVARQF